MRKICFITGTRADYGILAPVMREVDKNPHAQLQIIATNMHLSPEFGRTVNEIEDDGFHVDAKIDSLVSGGDAVATVKSMANVLDGLSIAFQKLHPDLVVVLGDRYEALAAAEAAVVFNIPVAHLHGGETTLGAIDDKFRHAITKLSDIHFAATPQYADRIIGMGQPYDKVFHSGAPGAEILEEKEFEKDVSFHHNLEVENEFFEKTGISAREPFIILAFHPVTLLPDKGESELRATLKALDTFINQGYKILVTMPNSDPGNNMISGMIKQWSESRQSGMVAVVKSLGARLFHFALENAAAMVGNSSAALIEAPSYRLGAVNVGERQRGRAHGITVVDVPGISEKIEKVIKNVLSLEMKAVLLGMSVAALNPYYKENAAAFIADKLIKLDL